MIERSSRQSQQRSSWLRAAALATIATATWITVASQPPAAEPASEYNALPPLPAIEGTCDGTRDRAAEQARVAEAGGLGAIERYPFDPRAGLCALERLRDAERCFLAAGDVLSAARVAGRARGWRARVERDYRDHGTRYRLAVASGRTPQALAELEFLLALLAQHGGAFADHLRRAQDALSAQSAAAKEPL